MSKDRGTTLWGSGTPMDERLDRYTVGDDRILDRALIRWDILGSMAHARGLEEAGVLTADERRTLHRALAEALEAAASGGLTVSERDEDVHSALEAYLVDRVGELGLKIHAGRSRNDQVQVDLRLLVKDRLVETARLAAAAAEALLDLASRHRETPLPGYTHLRRAMPSTVGLWAAGYADSLLESLDVLEAAWETADRCPLGSGAGYGVPLPLPRELVAELLGFSRIQHTVTAAQLARGKLEATVLLCLWPLVHDLGRLAWDVVLYSADEFGFLRIPPALATGSSIMPHKKNPDLFELTRARAAAFQGFLAGAMAVTGGLPGGYHRDLQLTKGPLLRGLESAADMLELTAWAVPRLQVDEERCRRAVGGELLVTDEVFARVRRGVPFRTAYREVAEQVASGWSPPPLDTASLLVARSSTGAAGNLGLPELRRRLAVSSDLWERRGAEFRDRLEDLVAGGDP